MGGRRALVLFFVLVLPAEAVFDAAVETQYFAGTITGAAGSGAGFDSKFSGYLVKSAIHLNKEVRSLIVGLGATASVLYTGSEGGSATTIDETFGGVRYGAELYVRFPVSRWFQPLMRFEFGRHNLTATNSGYPTITGGPGTGTAASPPLPQLKFTYQSSYFVIGTGIQSQVLPHIDLFLTGAYTAFTPGNPQVRSLNVDGVPVPQPAEPRAFRYAGYQIGFGAMFHL